MCILKILSVHIQFLHDTVVKIRPELLYFSVFPTWMHPVGQQHHHNFALKIHPERSTSIAEMANTAR